MGNAFQLLFGDIGLRLHLAEAGDMENRLAGADHRAGIDQHRRDHPGHIGGERGVIGAVARDLQLRLKLAQLGGIGIHQGLPVIQILLRGPAAP